MTGLLGKLKFAQQFPQQLSQQLPQLVVQRSRMLFSTLSFDDSLAFSLAKLVSVRKKTSFQIKDSPAW